MEELEECVLEKDQEIMRLQQIISRLQGEVNSCARALSGLKVILHLHFQSRVFNFGASYSKESVVAQS